MILLDGGVGCEGGVFGEEPDHGLFIGELVERGIRGSGEVAELEERGGGGESC